MSVTPLLVLDDYSFFFFSAGLSLGGKFWEERTQTKIVVQTSIQIVALP
jgi:hypothetical protein